MLVLAAHFPGLIMWVLGIGIKFSYLARALLAKPFFWLRLLPYVESKGFCFVFVVVFNIECVLFFARHILFVCCIM